MITTAAKVAQLNAHRAAARAMGLTADVERITRMINRLIAQSWEGVGTN